MPAESVTIGIFISDTEKVNQTLKDALRNYRLRVTLSGKLSLKRHITWKKRIFTTNFVTIKPVHASPPQHRQLYKHFWKDYTNMELIARGNTKLISKGNGWSCSWIYTA